MNRPAKVRMQRSRGTEGTPAPTPGDVSRLFVGRERELAELDIALDEALRGRGSLCLIGGEPGIGKTRLVEQLGAAARGRDASVYSGRCWESGGAPAYWPWNEIVRALSRDEDDETLLSRLGTHASRVAELVPELRHRFPDLPPTPALEAERSRFALFDGVVRFLRSAAAVRPLVLLLDDLHAADASALLLLRFLARELRDTPILVLGTYREAESNVSSPVARLLGDILREARHLPLRGFAREESASLIDSVAGAAVDTALTGRIHDATGGNPLFVYEVVRVLVAEGNLGSGHTSKASPLPIPGGIRQTFHRRLEPLSSRCRDVLAVASAFGNEFEVTLLSEVCGLAVNPLLALLGEALSAGIVTEISSSLGRFAFVHGVARETLYQGTPYGRRLELHRAIAEALERLYAADPAPHLDEIAFHFWCAAPAGERARAADYAIRAARQAESILAQEQAAVHYERALQLLESEPADERRYADTLLSLGEVLGRAGDAETSRRVFERAADVCRRLDDPKGLTRAALGFGGGGFGGIWAIVHSRNEQLVPLLEEALERLPPEDGFLRARVLARLATALHYAPARERRETLSRDAVAVARREKAGAALAFTLSARHYALCEPAHTTERFAIADEIVRLADRAQDRELDLQGRAFRIADLVEMGELPRAAHEIEAYSTLAGDLRQPFYLWYAVAWKAMCATTSGRFHEAEGLVHEALSIGRRAQEENARHTFGAQMFPLRWLRGEIEEAIPEVERLVSDYPAFAGWKYSLAFLYAVAGRTEDARRELGPAIGSDGRSVHGGFRVLITAFLGETCALLGDRVWAAALYETLRPFPRLGIADGHDVIACYGSVSHPLGLLAATIGLRDQAARHFEDAIAMHERMGARPFLARSLYESAQLLLDGTRADDRDRGAARARQALTIAEELGMRGLAPQIRALGIGTAPSTAPTGREAPGTPEPVEMSSPRRAVFRREGRYWRIAWGAGSVRLKDTIGLRYLSELLRRPGESLHLSELAACVTRDPAGTPPGGVRAGRDGRPAAGGDAGELLDARARAAYRERLRDLRDALTEAERKGDAERAYGIEGEIEALTRELSRAVGLGGRHRRAGSEIERLRIRVTKAIKTAIRKIREADPSLGHHLESTVRTGAFCSYTPGPDGPPSWAL